MPSSLPKKIYGCFSFSEGHRPDFEAMKTHFTPYGMFINNKGDSPVAKPFDEFAAFMNKNIDAGNILEIAESEFENNVQLFGKVGQMSSRYKLTVRTPNGTQTRYGINLFQIIKYGSEWKISSMCWDDYEDQRLFEKMTF